MAGDARPLGRYLMITKDCKHIYGLHVSGADNKPSKRVTWCCDLRDGFRLKQWRCVGLCHADCPLTAQQGVYTDAVDAAASTGISEASALPTSQTDQNPPQRG